jgi:hypothetical protein
MTNNDQQIVIRLVQMHHKSVVSLLSILQIRRYDKGNALATRHLLLLIYCLLFEKWIFRNGQSVQFAMISITFFVAIIST